MIALLQRVTGASVDVAAQRIAEIGAGLLVFIGVEAGDEPKQAERLLERITTYRVFADEAGRMNRSVIDVGGGLLLVPQFTLAADTQKGTRASFSSAACPDTGRKLYDHLVEHARALPLTVASGIFGAEMKVALVNDGPVTFLLRVRPPPQAV
ncbi:MAG TPA: D-aminoacyl-tRNA deacylase [Burkholderiales bacterium]|nr:D-aminoacyl-tRNA deacylase [Burkholderiales bacterium]